MTHKEWLAEAERLFGADPMQWRFICPSCHHVASVKDWIDAGAPEDAIAFSCVGRWANAQPDAAFAKRGGPCNYAGGGLFRLNPVAIEGRSEKVFAFASGDQ